jgi:hypothetical protein
MASRLFITVARRGRLNDRVTHQASGIPHIAKDKFLLLLFLGLYSISLGGQEPFRRSYNVVPQILSGRDSAPVKFVHCNSFVTESRIHVTSNHGFMFSRQSKFTQWTWVRLILYVQPYGGKIPSKYVWIPHRPRNSRSVLKIERSNFIMMAVP